MNDYVHLLNKELFIDSTAYFHNEVLDIGCSTFSDVMKNSDTPYHFSSDDKQMALGCISNRQRESVIFETSDISNLFDRKLNKWMNDEKNRYKELAQSTGEFNKYYLNLSLSDKMIMVQPIKIRENSLLKPFYLGFETGGGYAVKENELSKMKIYTFSDSDIIKLKKELENVIGCKYAIYSDNLKDVSDEPIKKEIPDYRIRELFAKALNWLTELESGQELYTTLHEVLGMTNEEIETENFNLHDYYDTPKFSELITRDESGIPEYCYSSLRENGEIILIRRGENGYHNLDEDFVNQIEGNSPKEIVQKLNEPLGITNAEEQAMSFGSMFGWDKPGADPKVYEKLSESNNEDEYEM